MAKIITLKLNRVKLPRVMQIYGVEGAKNLAINMCKKQGMEITETNLYSVLNNLESDLRMQSPMYTEVE